MIADIFINVLATLWFLWLGWAIYDTGFDNGKTAGSEEATRKLAGKSEGKGSGE